MHYEKYQIYIKKIHLLGSFSWNNSRNPMKNFFTAKVDLEIIECNHFEFQSNNALIPKDVY